VKHSKGRFGFSVQKHIYESLGGTTEYDEQVWNNFEESVVWRRLYYNGDIFFVNKAPERHLPNLLSITFCVLIKKVTLTS
jgi:hypothetical protein